MESADTYISPAETGLYYLQSRYYNPEIGRFINADSLVSTDQGILGYNMFAYCGNNPVSRSDESGHAWYDTLWDWVNTIAGVLNPVSTSTALGSIAVATLDGRWSDVVHDWNNGCMNPFNQSESDALKAKVLGFYKGSTVVRQDVVGYCSAFGTLWLNTGNDETDIMHEYGHSIQERLMGPLYWTRIAIPSVINNAFGSNEILDYYSMPWERTADLLGGVKENRGYGYKSGSLAWAITENLLGPGIIPFYFYFGY